MKIVMIHGQNHKGSTYHVGKIFAEKVGSEEEITEFFLPRDLNHFCIGCCRCLDADENCPFYEDKKVIMDAIEEAELLVFTTPTYCMRASAPMKSFIDLTFTNWLPHRPKEYMFKKKAVVFSTAAGAGMRGAIKDVKNCLSYWGISYIKTFGMAVSAMNWEGVPADKKQRIEEETTKLADQVKNDKVKVSLKTKFLFKIMGKNVDNPENVDGVLKGDYHYWKEKGWLDGVSPFKE